MLKIERNPKFYIVVKKTVDWKNMTLGKFKESNSRCGMHEMQNKKGHLQACLETIEAWNKIFKISYFEYREQIKKITFSNLKEIDGIEGILINKDDCLQGEFLNKKLNKGSIILPIDDDDLFHPKIVMKLKKHINDFTELYYWNFITNCDNNNWRINNFSLSNHGVKCQTNNYALSTPLNFINIRYHYTTEDILNNKYIDENLSVKNKLLSSIFHLRLGNINKNNILQKYKKQTTDEKIPIPKEYEWAEKYVKMISKIDGDFL